MKWKSPVRRRRGPEKSLYAVFSARETFGSPAQGGLKNERGAHHSGRAIETAHDDFSQNENGRLVAELRASRRNRRDRVTRSWPSRLRDTNLTQPDRTAAVCVPFHNWDHV